MKQLTPMMKQYMDIKEKHKDSILFFRLGDFYEMFFEDAITASNVLELTLTGRDCGLDERAPMCGVPYHSAEGYIQKLVEKGYKVAISEQTSDPALSKGLVEREVVRIVTPGTLMTQGKEENKTNRFLLSLFILKERIGIAFADVSTGEFFVNEVENNEQAILNELDRIAPMELISNDIDKIKKLIPSKIVISEVDDSIFRLNQAKKTLKGHFNVEFLSALGLEDKDHIMLRAGGSLINYLIKTQKNSLEHITKIERTSSQSNLFLDSSTKRNLELTRGIYGDSGANTLLSLLDKTSTAMGARMLRLMVESPLADIEKINARLDAVGELKDDYVLSENLSAELKQVYDVERLVSKISYKSLNARDCIALQQSFKKVETIKNMLSKVKSDLLIDTAKKLNPLKALTGLLEAAIHPEAPLVMNEGNIINDGFNPTLDELREATAHGKKWLLDLEARERKETGIKNLRIQYNRVFGYYIEVTKSYYDLVPLRYQRKQTLANAERFIIPELKQIEDKITGAQQKAQRLELELFDRLREEIKKEIKPMQETASSLKYLDALTALAKTAQQYHYIRPIMADDGEIHIIEGRHPVVEYMERNEPFVPNDTHMNNDDRRMMIVTGPNMAGKSTYMRQTALIAIMAHMGSFVPAKKAKIPLIDRVFTRIGASDDLASGKSTFMVEMIEVANILRNATEKSLIILDEIGRGTSTFDGLAIAWSVVEYICDKDKIGGKTLFATHYHELSQLEGYLDGVINYRTSVVEKGEDIIFLRKIAPGGADKSFGVHVASLAGLPMIVLQRAREIQARLEINNINQSTIGQNILETGENKKDEQVDMFQYKTTELVKQLQDLDVMGMTPIDAMNELFLIREKARKL